MLFAVLKMEPRASGMLDKHSANDLHFRPYMKKLNIQ